MSLRWKGELRSGMRGNRVGGVIWWWGGGRRGLEGGMVLEGGGRSR